jgi:hypothetical protein
MPTECSYPMMAVLAGKLEARGLRARSGQVDAQPAGAGATCIDSLS